jgi:hypothetical protein
MNERDTRRLRPGSIGSAVLIVAMALLGTGLLAGCSAGPMASWTAAPADGSSATATAAGDHGMAMMSDADAAAMWSARPAFVRGADARVQEAYQYALSAGGALRYMPCYCGCAAMEHRSNLDCFLRRPDSSGSAGFEEHASYCDVCVQTALMAKQMRAAGSSLGEIRAAVDATFGGSGSPGTPTELPPSS